MALKRASLTRRLSRVWCLIIMAAALLPQAQAAHPQTPEEMYQYAVRQLDRGYYEKAVSVFEQIKTRYPFSKYAVLAELRIGDAHFKKGEYLEAVDAYRNFIKLHPRHPELDYVVYRIGLSQFKDAPKWVQRDQTSTRQMLATIAHFEERFPDSEYTDEVQAMRQEGRLRLARGVFAIGRFYYKRGRYNTRGDDQKAAYAAAIGRFEQVLDEYPDVTEMAIRAMVHIGTIQLHLGEYDEAAETLERLKTRYPDAEAAITLLEDRIARADHKGTSDQQTEPAPGPESQEKPPGLIPQWDREPEATGNEEPPPPPPPPPPRAEDDDFMPVLEPTPPPNDGDSGPTR